jgi:2-dehydropantoate 2-reductase
MKICVVGAGAIGGYLGARLAMAGEQVCFIARNRNLEAINSQGFKLILAARPMCHRARPFEPSSTSSKPVSKMPCC